MTDEEFVFHETSRERKRNGQGDYHKKRCGGRQVRLSTDRMSRREWERMNGEITTVRMNEPKTWAQYKELSEDLQSEYLNMLFERYHATPVMMAKMMGVSRNAMLSERKRKGIMGSPRGTVPESIRKEWERFLGDTETPEQSEETPPKDVALIEQLLTLLQGTGAKITIEVTL